MGLFDKVRQVLTRVVGERSDSDRASKDAGSTADRPAASQEHLPSPGTAEPAQSLTTPSPEPTPGTAASEQPEGPAASKQPENHAAPEATAPAVADEDVREADAARPGDEETPEEHPRRYRTHTIQPDQSLAEVAALHGVDVEQVAELNGLDPELIFAGQVVRIPHV